MLGLAGALASGAALGVYAQLERYDPWLGFVMLVPWLAAQDAARSWREALAMALAFCVAFTLCVFAWFAGAIANYTGAPVWTGWLALLLLAPLLLQPQVWICGLARHGLRRRGAGAPRLALATACTWVGAEWLIPKLFADSLGHGFFPSLYLRQAADLAGVGGLTLVILLVNECVLATLRGVARGGAWRPAVCGAALVAALLGYGALRLRSLDAEVAAATPLRAGLVQADISHYGSLARRVGTFEAVAEILEAHVALSQQALAEAPLDLLVWPETVYPTTFGAPKSEAGAGFDRALAALVQQTRVPLVFGAFDRDGDDEFNAAVFLEPDGDGQVSFDTYRKAWLFPLTERVPAWLDSAWLRERLPWLGRWRAGSGAHVLALRLADGRSISVAPLICYDATVPWLARAAAREGAELIVTLSNDSWFAAGGGPRLHFAVSAFRSLETRRAQLRVTNTGISAGILPSGELVALAGVHDRSAIVATLPVFAARPTLAVAWGEWLGPLAAGLGVLGLVLPVSGSGRSRSSPGRGAGRRDRKRAAAR